MLAHSSLTDCFVSALPVSCPFQDLPSFLLAWNSAPHARHAWIESCRALTFVSRTDDYDYFARAGETQQNHERQKIKTPAQWLFLATCACTCMYLRLALSFWFLVRTQVIPPALIIPYQSVNCELLISYISYHYHRPMIVRKYSSYVHVPY